MYQARTDRYHHMTYARCGRSGIDLPRVALGLWHNFDGDRLSDRARRMLLIVLRPRQSIIFDLANNYGPPRDLPEKTSAGSARDLKRYRDELIISTRPAGECGRGHTGIGGQQIPAGQPRPEPEPTRARLCRHLLLTSIRSRDAARRDEGASSRRCWRQGAVCRNFLV